MDMMPVRLQLSRRKGFNLQALSHAANGLDAVTVARPSKFGNPWRIGRDSYGAYVEGPGFGPTVTRCGNREGAQLVAVGRFRDHLPRSTFDLASLRGKNLACWCKPGAPCHADVLLEIANP